MFPTSRNLVRGLPAVLFAVTVTAVAVFPAQADTDTDAEAATARNVFVAPDRTVVRLLGKATELVDQKRYAEAARVLGAILQQPEDYFLEPTQSGSVRGSLKSEAQRILGAMPRQGRDFYELQFGAQARQLLADAAATGDAAGLAEVSRQYFHTQAGYQATLLLGMNQLSDARPLAAALTFQRLRRESPDADRFEPTLSSTLATCWLRSQMPEKAWRVLAELRQRLPESKVTIGGREVALFNAGSGSLDPSVTPQQAQALAADPDTPLGKLARLVGMPPESLPDALRPWAMMRGDPARTGAASAGAPLLLPRWRVTTTDDPDVAARVDGIREDLEDQGRTLLPAFQPLVVDDMLLMRTARDLLAVDFRTGKRKWRVDTDDPFGRMLNPSFDTLAISSASLAYALRTRMWEDATYGTLSSDGQSVFAVEGIEIHAESPYEDVLIFNVGGRTGEAEFKSNRLVAYDLHTGKLQWQIGGPEGEGALAEAGTFFLGPPLPLMRELYVLAEVKGEIRLLALDAAGGKRLWAQPLADVDRATVSDSLLRRAGLSPSYADGILVCPTCSHAIVAVELATRSLLWGFAYSAPDDRNDRPRMFLRFPRTALNRGDRWMDSTVTLSDGYVLATLPDSDEIHCLKLTDGSLRWKHSQSGDLYRACVYDGKVVMVGSRQMRAWNLDDGKPAWDSRRVRFPDGARPSGTGFLSGNLYFVPLNSAEVMAVDLDAGRNAGVSRSRRGTVPGNLISYGDKIISQRAGAIEVFDQFDALAARVARDLDANPQDADALASRGEILWYEGKREEAIAACRHALVLELPARLRQKTRDLLLDAYFEGLTEDFATYRDDIDEIRRLLDTSGEHVTFLRLLALGYEAAGDFHPALENYEKLIAVESENGKRDSLEPVDRELAVRLDRWIRARLGPFRYAAPPDVREELDSMVDVRLKRAAKDENPELLAAFLDFFGDLPAAEQAADRLAERYRRLGRRLEAELLAHGTKTADTRSTAPGGGPKQDSPWPDGEVTVTSAATAIEDARQPTDRAMPIEYQGSLAPTLADVHIELASNPTTLLGRDGWGNVAWQLPLPELSDSDDRLNRNPLRTAAAGHLLLLRCGNRVATVDLLGKDDGGPPRVFWSSDLEDPRKTAAMPSDDDVEFFGRNPFAPGAGPVVRYISRDSGGASAAAMLAGGDLACMMGHRRLIALDPANGRILWVREKLPPESNLFGDRKYVFVVPPGRNAATVLRATDGHLLGTRALAPQAERLTTLGRLVVQWRMHRNRRVLELVDPWDQTPAWPAITFAASAKPFLLQAERKLAVFESKGRFVMVDLDDGQTVIDARTVPEPDLSAIYVFPSPDHYLLVTQSADGVATRTAQRHVQSLPLAPSVELGKGHMMAFDREGHPLWNSPRLIENECLPLNQPPRLPVVTFASFVRERTLFSGYTMGVSILSIDKRTGRTVLKKTFAKPSSAIDIVGDPQKKTVTFQMQQTTVTMAFTDTPAEPNREVDAKDAAEAAARPTEAVWKAIRNAAGGAVPSLEPLP